MLEWKALRDNEEDFRRATVCCSFVLEIVHVRRARRRRPLLRCFGRRRRRVQGPLDAEALLPAAEGLAPTRGGVGCGSPGGADGAEPRIHKREQQLANHEKNIGNPSSHYNDTHSDLHTGQEK